VRGPTGCHPSAASSRAPCASSRRKRRKSCGRSCAVRASNGAKFRRQFPIDCYVVDFYCHAAKLAVELDGCQHEWFAEYDAGRTEVLERTGVRVIRFANEDVCADLDSVLALIRAELQLPFL